LRGINLTRCKPPVDESELAEIANGAATQANRPDFKMLDPEVARLAAMSPLDYEKIRKSDAKRLGVRVNVLDAEVEKLRPRALEKESEPLAPPAPEPWAESVEARAVLDELRAFIRRFVLVDAHALIAVVLWIVFTYVFQVAETSPRLAITSPIKRCGKTRLLEILLMLCPRAVSLSNMSTNSVFRVIDAAHPTLLIDEADTLRANDKDELRGILNSGHTPANAYVIRNVPVGDSWRPKRFSTWAAVAMGGIGKLPDTWADRSITISMQRKPPREPVERLTRRNVAAREQAVALASKLARLAHDNLDILREAIPAIPESLNDRQADNWELLLAIADLAGADWSQRAREAALALSGDGAGETDSLGERLLRDVRDTFSARQADRLSSKALCEALCSIEGAPWSEFGRTRKPLTPNRLARLLAPFMIASHTIRLDEGTAKGYLVGDFADAFDRYLAIPSVSGGNSVTSAVASGADVPIQSVTDKPGDVSENGTKLTSDGACDVVTARNRQNGYGRRVSPVEEAEIDRLARADADGQEPRR
jgi:putative DNA primase/helicase